MYINIIYINTYLHLYIYIYIYAYIYTYIYTYNFVFFSPQRTRFQSNSRRYRKFKVAVSFDVSYMGTATQK